MTKAKAKTATATATLDEERPQDRNRYGRFVKGNNANPLGGPNLRKPMVAPLPVKTPSSAEQFNEWLFEPPAALSTPRTSGVGGRFFLGIFAGVDGAGPHRGIERGGGTPSPLVSRIQAVAVGGLRLPFCIRNISTSVTRGARVP